MTWFPEGATHAVASLGNLDDSDDVLWRALAEVREAVGGSEDTGTECPF